MSMHTYMTYGCGIRIKEVTPHGEDCVERLKALLSKAPEYQRSIQDWLNECGVDEPCWDDFMEFDQDYDLGLATILHEVILEAEGLQFVACSSYEGEQYLLFTPVYPWEIKEKEKDLTEDKIKEILRRYTSLLVDGQINVDYWEAENYG